MEEQTTKTITAFDSLFTTNRIQLLKILLPRLAPRQQSCFAVYIKLLELQYTLSFLRSHPGMRLMGDGRQLSADFSRATMRKPWTCWTRCSLSAARKSDPKSRTSGT